MLRLSPPAAVPAIAFRRFPAMERMGDKEFLARLLATKRLGIEQVLAFYDSTVDAICTNGQYLLIPLIDHLCHRGDALFESITVREGVIYSLDGHLDRLRKGCDSAMQMTPPLDWDVLRGRIVDVVRVGGEKNCNVRIFLGRGAGSFGISPLDCPVCSLYIVALRDRRPDPSVYEKGISAFTSAIPPKQQYLATIKSTNYVPNMLMAREAAERGMDVAVTFHEDGTMGEAAVANIGIVDGEGRLVCPPLDRILAGTSMLCAMKVADGHMPVVVRDVTREDIAKAREMLLFASSKLCLAITHFDGRPVGDGRPGPVAHWLYKAMQQDMLATGTPVWGGRP